ncbi:MAG: 4-(cytidine 5'-diphospho)-2-C-methyl-D-erythritol kinase [Defluviitaleaceae bacterium]|nr:4-(cytidine 5'-diphospho)-2-C-methyl-D-erythritol kinase [Defluviitaleaceae bacterium]
MQIRAFSKINLLLEVVKKRQDGYHELVSVMQSLALSDTVTISMANNSEISHAIELVCNNPNLPTDDRNLVTRAAKYMIQEYNIRQPIKIQLEKRIPIAAGLAGGSSDCAAALLGINKLFDLGIPLYSAKQASQTVASYCPSKAQIQNKAASLMEIGKQFGADVPFCLMANAAAEGGATALAEGIGEKLTPLAPHPNVWVVLVCPGIPVSTADIFSRYNAKMHTQPLADGQSNTASNCSAMINAITKGDVHAITANFKNDLSQITTQLHPEVQNIINEMKNQGAIGAAMSGSGPSVFGYFSDKKSAEKAYKNFYHIEGRAFLTYTK